MVVVKPFSERIGWTGDPHNGCHKNINVQVSHADGAPFSDLLGQPMLKTQVLKFQFFMRMHATELDGDNCHGELSSTPSWDVLLAMNQKQEARKQVFPKDEDTPSWDVSVIWTKW